MSVKALVWGLGKIYDKYLNLLRYQILLGELDIIAITQKTKEIEALDGFQFCPRDKINLLTFDCIIVATDERNYQEITGEIKELGIDPKKSIPITVFEFPGFSIKKYWDLVQNPISIIASCCWGGLTYHSLALEMNSPLVNMRISQKEFIKMVVSLKQYMGLEPQFIRWEETTVLENNHKFPVMLLGDIELHCVHYGTPEEVICNWKRRAKRINYNNIFIMMETTDIYELKLFETLPYKNKICFVPFDTDVECAYVMKGYDNKVHRDFNFYVNHVAMKNYKEYDLLSLLTYMGKKVDIIKRR